MHALHVAHPAGGADWKRATATAPWWGHLAWAAGAAVLGFCTPAVLVGIFHMPRGPFVLPYALLSLGFLYLYVRWSGVDLDGRLRDHWARGVLAALAVGAFVVANVVGQPASAAPVGLELVGAILWLGVVYGAVDALLLSILPLFATWHALSALGWTATWKGRALSGVLAMLASVAVAAGYHLGYPEFRGPAVVAPIVGNGALSLATLLTMSPIAAVVGHIAMHIAAVLHGIDTAVQLPPHY